MQLATRSSLYTTSEHDIYPDEMELFAVSVHCSLKSGLVDPVRLFLFQSQRLPTSVVDQLDGARHVVVSFEKTLERLHDTKHQNITRTCVSIL